MKKVKIKINLVSGDWIIPQGYGELMTNTGWWVQAIKDDRTVTVNTLDGWVVINSRHIVSVEIEEVPDGNKSHQVK